MNALDIIYAMSKAGHPPCSAARALGVSRSMVSQVIHGKATSYNVASYIASVTNTPLSRLWTDGRYSKP